MADSSARLPADLGLSGLGLIMQLAGTVFAAVTSVFGLIMVVAVVQTNAAHHGHADSPLMVWVLMIVVSGATRSMAHRAAGTRLIYGDPTTPFAGIRRYLVVSAIQTVVWIGFFALELHAPASIVATIAITMAAWPAALGVILLLPRFRQLERGLPLAEDKGFEGASILMLIFGLAGLGFGLAMLAAVLQLPTWLLAQIFGILTVILLGMLVIRSVLHIIAGWRGVNTNNMDRAVEAANRYGNFGVITALSASAVLLILMMSIAADVSGLLVLVLVGWLLISWPLIIRKFFVERQFADLISGGGVVHHRSPDFGTCTLGWLLIALGVMALAGTLPGALWHGHGAGESGDPIGLAIGMTPGSLRSPWWGVGAAGLQLWTGIELVRMGEHHRALGTAYGLIGTAVAIYINRPIVEEIKHLADNGLFSRSASGGPQWFTAVTAGLIVPIASIAIGLFVPIATAVLVNTKIAPETARPPGPPPIG